MKEKTAVLSYNQVQKELADELNKKGCTSELIKADDIESLKDGLRQYSHIVLPFPSNKKTLSCLRRDEDFAEIISPGHIVIGGMISHEFKDILKKNKISFFDYFTSEAYKLKNAFITSQGALRLLTEHTTGYLPGSKVLITGYGRIGKSLANMLKAIGMKVFVVARSETALAEAKASGYEVFNYSQLKSTVFYYDYIFNTVPAIVFDERDVKHMNTDVIYFELASAPYGADKSYFELYGKKHIEASALPGKFYPNAVAKNISDFIIYNWRHE